MSRRLSDTWFSQARRNVAAVAQRDDIASQLYVLAPSTPCAGQLLPSQWSISGESPVDGSPSPVIANVKSVSRLMSGRPTAASAGGCRKMPV